MGVDDSLVTHLPDGVELLDAAAIPLDPIARDQPVIAIDCFCHIGEPIGCQLGSEFDGVKCDFVWNSTGDGWLEMSGVARQGDARLKSPGLLRRKYEKSAAMGDRPIVSPLP